MILLYLYVHILCNCLYFMQSYFKIIFIIINIIEYIIGMWIYQLGSYWVALLHEYWIDLKIRRLVVAVFKLFTEISLKIENFITS